MRGRPAYLIRRETQVLKAERSNISVWEFLCVKGSACRRGSRGIQKDPYSLDSFFIKSTGVTLKIFCGYMEAERLGNKLKTTPIFRSYS